MQNNYKNLIFLFFILIQFQLYSQEINWMSLDEVREAQKTNPKNVLIDVYTNWCGPCKLMDRNTFSNTDIIRIINENYYAVKFNAEGNKEVNFKGNIFKNPNYDPAKAQRRNASHELAQYYRIRSYPTILFLDEEANLITPVVGYKTPQQLEIFLTIFKGDKYKEVKTQKAFNDYYEAFKPTFGQTK